MTNWYGYPYIALTGGADGALDSLDGSLLKDGDFAVVVTKAGVTYVYTLDEDSAATESSPDVISPDSNAGDKRWILTSVKSSSADSTFTQVGTGAVTVSSQTKMRQVFSAADFGTLAQAVAALNTAGGGRLDVGDSTYTVSDDLSIPSGVEINVWNGGLISVASGKTVTFASGSKFNSGIYQAFTGDGTIVFGLNSVHRVHPEWWGTFPNGTNDTAILNKAIAACKIGADANRMGYAVLTIGPGKYYVTAGGLSDIECSFDAPNAYFYPTANTDASYVMLPFSFDDGIAPNFVNIGGIIGTTDYDADPATHYHTGIHVKKGDGVVWNIGWIVSQKIGVLFSGLDAEDHVGIHRMNIWTVVGCYTGISFFPGAGDDAVEANRVYIDYLTFCQIGAIFYSNGTTSNALCFNNVVEINVMELNGLSAYNRQGFLLAGEATRSNRIRVTGGLVPPAEEGSYIVTLDDGCLENMIELCYMDWDLIYWDVSAGYNVFNLSGSVNSSYPALFTNDLGRSEIMAAAAPTAGVWRVGDRCWNSAPAANGTMGWVCTTSSNNNAGVWKTFGTIAA